MNQRIYDSVEKLIGITGCEPEEYRQVADQLQRYEDRFQILLQDIQSVSVQGYGSDGTTRYWNPASEILYGYTAAEAIGRNLLELIIPPGMRSDVASAIKHMAQTGEPIPASELQLMRKDGSLVTVFSSHAIVQMPGQDQELFCFDIDLTDRKNIEDALRISEEKYRLITENASDVISVYNLTLEKFTYYSPSVFQMRGLSAEAAMQESLEEALMPESLGVVKRTMAENLARFQADQQAAGGYITEIQQPCMNGDIIWVELSTKYRYNTEGHIETVGVSRDITERKRAEEEILRLSYRDHLTGLYNRRFYEEELMRLDTKRNLPITLIMGDVNGLKLINDSFGHAMGDELLKRVAEVITKGCRGDDIIARLGGDEFVIILPKTDLHEAEEIIRRINELSSQEKTFSVDLSISFGHGTKHFEAENIHEILRSVEDHMYRQKLYDSSSMRSRTIDLIINTLYEKSKREMHHSKRVSGICAEIASRMGFEKEAVNQIRIAGLMHDIGKIGIDEKFLDKPFELDGDEWKEMRRHPEIGYRILSSVKEFSEIAGYVLEHQERWDGKGYPRGLKGDTISVQARIIAIADAYDAMTSDRSYRKALSKEEALNEIRRCSGKQFDPEIVTILTEMILYTQGAEAIAL